MNVQILQNKKRVGIFCASSPTHIPATSLAWIDFGSHWLSGKRADF